MTPHPQPATDPADGVVEQRDGRTVLRFERRLRHPIERVWAALTEPARLASGSPRPSSTRPSAAPSGCAGSTATTRATRRSWTGR